MKDRTIVCQHCGQCHTLDDCRITRIPPNLTEKTSLDGTPKGVCVRVWCPVTGHRLIQHMSVGAGVSGLAS